MNDLLGRLKEESGAFESALGRERQAMAQAIEQLGGEAQKFETVTARPSAISSTSWRTPRRARASSPRASRAKPNG